MPQKSLLISEDQALNIIDYYYSYIIYQSNKYVAIDTIRKYCLCNSKSYEDTHNFISDLIVYDLIEYTIGLIVDILTENFNIISVYHKDGTYFKSYINKINKQNGKERIY